MANIFENAYFGKPYKTRDNKKSLLIKILSNGYYFLKEGGVRGYFVDKNGCHQDVFQENNDMLDIVSEWQEEFDEDKIYNSAKDAFKHSAFKIDDGWEEAVYCTGYHEGWCDAIKTIQGGNDV